MSSSSSSSSRVPCPHCAKDFKNKGSLRGHVRKLHGKTEAIEESSPQEVVAGPQDAVSVPLHPVLDMDIMNISANDFKGCRVTPDGSISVFDAIGIFMQNPDRPSRAYWQEIQKKSERMKFHALKIHKFPDARQATPVANFTTLIEILSLLPGPKAKALRSQQAQLSARAVAGDRALEEALPVQRERVGEEMQAVLMSGLEGSEGGGVEGKGETPVPIDCRAHATLWIDIRKQQAEDFSSHRQILAEMETGHDERDKMYARDVQRQLLRKRSAELMFSPQQLLLSFNGDKSARVEDSSSLPPPPRRELSIPLVAAAMGLNARNKGAVIGKVLVALWRLKYKLDSKAQPVKRDTTFQGRPITENTYYAEDEDIMRQAIQQVCGGGGEEGEGEGGGEGVKAN